jgi:hypothetical protein
LIAFSRIIWVGGVGVRRQEHSTKGAFVFTADQLVAHAVGDYLLQNDWMARHKGGSHLAALTHVFFYSLPFLFLTQNPLTLVVIAGTHFAIDRWRLARFLIWGWSRIFPGGRPWNECSKTGHPPDLPDYMARWLLIIVDQIMHILINGAALAWIG